MKLEGRSGQHYGIHFFQGIDLPDGKSFPAFGTAVDGFFEIDEGETVDEFMRRVSAHSTQVGTLDDMTDDILEISLSAFRERVEAIRAIPEYREELEALEAEASRDFAASRTV